MKRLTTFAADVSIRLARKRKLRKTAMVPFLNRRLPYNVDVSPMPNARVLGRRLIQGWSDD